MEQFYCCANPSEQQILPAGGRETPDCELSCFVKLTWANQQDLDIIHGCDADTSKNTSAEAGRLRKEEQQWQMNILITGSKSFK